MTFPILASLLVRLVVLLPFQLLRLSLATPSRWTPLIAGQIGRRITISTTPVIAGDSFEMDAVGALRLSPLRRGLAIDSTVDRKSGSAGMPRPISYAVFCLKKKKKTVNHSFRCRRAGADT